MPRSKVQVRVEVDDGPHRKPLKFFSGNAKLHDGIFTFSLPAGWTCRFASACLSKADRKAGYLKDGRVTKYRCYAATNEARCPTVRKARWHNLDQLKACGSRGEMTRLILDSLSPFVRLLRVHDSGDFISQHYFDAWLEVAQQRPDTTCYFYTKAIPYWVERLEMVGNGYEPGKLTNVVPTASLGGTHDPLISHFRLRTARVVYSEDEAADLGLLIDHDDRFAMEYGPDFALLLHGQQPRGSDAAEAAKKLRERGWRGYGRHRMPLPTVS